MNKKALFMLFIFLGLAAGTASQWPDGKFRVIACDVGQGDAILLTQGFTQVLVDGGPSSRVINCLSSHMPFWDRTVEVVMATHPDKDHISGLISVMENYKLMSFVSINKANSSAELKNLQNAILENQVPVNVAKTGDSIIAGKIKLDLLWPEKDEDRELVWLSKGEGSEAGQTLGASDNSRSESTNDFSVVARASFGEFDVLLTGDIGKSIEEKLVERFDLSNIEVLKVGHHGSKYSTGKELLEEVKPKVALISVGKNPWGHPAEEVISNLKEVGAKISRTDLQGDIEIVSDGERYWKK